MEPLTIATTFATIVSLMATYKAESKNTSSDEYNDFLLWLANNRHEEIVELLKNNEKLAFSTRDTLNTQNEIFSEQLVKLDQGIANIASKLDCFSGIAQNINPHSAISAQAYSILEQLVHSGATHFIEFIVRTKSGSNRYILMGGKIHGDIEYREPQYIRDDLLSLVDAGLLRLDYGSKGSRLFYVTRSAENIIKNNL